jgi:hypothetical protein
MKGTHYHLLYTLWLLICEGLPQVWFYEGNDLLARPTPPPEEVGSEQRLFLKASLPARDLWIQLKSTDAPWTLSDLLDGNLLTNFILNALRSIRAGREWDVRLVTQGRLPRADIEDFLQSQEAKPRLAEKLREKVDAARSLAADEGLLPETSDGIDLMELTREVLRRLSLSQPTPATTLLAEVERELTVRLIDPEVVARIVRALLGGLLEDAARGPGAAPIYNEDWVSARAGMPVGARDALLTRPGEVCKDASRRATPREWDLSRFVPRRLLDRALHQFLQGPESVFVLVGPSGSGKSWAAWQWLEGRHGQLRLAVRGIDLQRERTLPGLLHRTLSRYTFLDGDRLARRLEAAARLPEYGPFVLLVDDLRLPERDEESFRADVGRLAEDCRDSGFKLILVCEDAAWRFGRLAQHFPPESLFVFDEEARQEYQIFSEQKGKAGNAEPPPSGFRQGVVLVSANPADRDPESYSFFLEDFSPEEFGQALERWEEARSAPGAGLWLRASRFAALRKPYLLHLALQQQAGEDVPEGCLVDVLLEGRFFELIRRAATALKWDAHELAEAFQELLPRLWQEPRHALPQTQVVRHLEAALPGQGQAALIALRRPGLLTSEAPVRIAEPLLADFLFAAVLLPRLTAGEDLAAELDPAQDSGTLVALLRRASPQASIALAGTLLDRDRRWEEAVATGLAQTSGNDYTALSFLTTLTRPPGDLLIGHAGCAALGQLAAINPKAWRWVRGMYLSERKEERNRGAFALAAAMELVPEQVAETVEERLRTAEARAATASRPREAREHWLDGALYPLSRINHALAAEAGARLLSRYEANRPLDGRAEQRFLQQVDEARGRVALFGGPERLSALLAELQSDNAATRQRAAVAVRTIAFEAPERVTEALLAAIRSEENPQVLNALLWIAYPLVQATPDSLLDALAGSRATRWGETVETTGLALTLLGNLSSHDPERVMRLLPEDLDSLNPELQALLAESFAYAWWQCGEGSEDPAKAPLHLDWVVRTVPERAASAFRPFAFRAAAVAQLARICLEEGIASGLLGRQTPYPRTSFRFLYVDLDGVVERHAPAILAHPTFPGVRDCFLEALRAKHGGPLIRPPALDDQALGMARHWCAQQCLEVLVLFARRMADPLPLLKEIPTGEQALRFARRLLEGGHRDATLLEFIRELCERCAYSGTLESFAERSRCLSRLAELDPDPLAALETYRQDTRSGSFRSDERAVGLARLADCHPNELLSLLDAAIQTDEDLITLYYWEELARSWQSLLLTRVYGRMFCEETIPVEEARDLCEQMLTVVLSLPESPHRQHYIAIYEAIALWVAGKPVLPPVWSEGKSVIQRSHAAAVAILTEGFHALSEGQDASWIPARLVDRGGWQESYSFSIEVGEVTVSLGGGGQYLFYMFPAPRLAWIAVGASLGQEDPGTALLLERKQVAEFLLVHSMALDLEPRLSTSREEQRDAVRAIREQLERTPRDERLWVSLGNLLLRLGRLRAAERVLRYSLTLPAANDETRRAVCYDLACVYARSGREAESRAALEERGRLGTLDPEWLRQDPDLDSVRNREWFNEFLGSPAVQANASE